MSRARNQSRPGGAAAANRRAPQRRPHLPPRSRTREWVFRLLAMFVVPLVLLGCVEGVLRLAGYGFATEFFKPFKIDGQDCLVENDQFGLRFFPPALARFPAPIVMSTVKPPNTTRIFIFGESAALGDPRPHFGAARYLEVLLGERFPDRRFEVVNTAMTAINSHVILPLARECASHQGDLWLIFMGNNEMVGPFGAATVFGRKAPPLWLVRTTLALQRSRLCQWLLALGRRFEAPGQASWQGMEMFVQNKVPPGDPRRRAVYRNFQKNLDEIIEAGLNSGARILLSTVAVNLKDCPPFASSTPSDVTQADLKRFDDLFAEALTAEKAGNFAHAKAGYEQAIAINPDSAELQFRLGQCCLQLGDEDAGAQHLQLAVDEDSLPFRADSRINGVIRQAAERFAGPNLALCDASASMARIGPSGVPGHELFYEHVHLNFDGNYRLAKLWAQSVERLLPLPVPGRTAGDWISQQDCERRLGLTDWNRLSVFEEIGRRLNRPPFSGQSENSTRLEITRREIELLRRQAGAPAIEPARKLYSEAINRFPRDPQLHEAYAEFLEDIHEREAAAKERRRVCELIPHYYFPYFSLGQLQMEQGQLAEALESFKQASALAPRSSEIPFQVGRLYGRQSQWSKALDQFNSARKLGYSDPRLLLYTAEVLLKLGRHDESIQNLRLAIQRQPDFWEAHFRLGDELAAGNDLAGAVFEFQQTLRFNSTYVKAHLKLGDALVKLGRSGEAAHCYDEALRLEPSNPTALDFKRKAARPGPS